MSIPTALTIDKIQFWSIDIPMTDPFRVATGGLDRAQNIYVRLTLAEGVVGYGEIAPFPDACGEEGHGSLAAAQLLARHLLGQSLLHFGRLSAEMFEIAPANPAARCGLETAVLDALGRVTGVPLWGLWGGTQVRARESDITIPITSRERTRELARLWYARGFRTLKIKVGRDVDEDIRRIEAVHDHLPDVRFLVDPNQGYGREEAALLVREVRKSGGSILLLEQPLVKEDLEGHAKLRRDLRVPVAVDESVRSLVDVRSVVRHQAADFINIKITKSGVLEGLAMARFARASGLRLMIGGMVETRLAMGCSFAIVMGLGSFEVLDLDTPLLLAEDPVEGGYTYRGAWLEPWTGPGLALEVRPGPAPFIE